MSEEADFPKRLVTANHTYTRLICLCPVFPPPFAGQQQAGAGGGHVPGLDASGAPVHGVAARPAPRGRRRDGQAPGQVQHLQGVPHHRLQVRWGNTGVSPGPIGRLLRVVHKMVAFRCHVIFVKFNLDKSTFLRPRYVSPVGYLEIRSL